MVGMLYFSWVHSFSLWRPRCVFASGSPTTPRRRLTRAWGTASTSLVPPFYVLQYFYRDQLRSCPAGLGPLASPNFIVLPAVFLEPLFFLAVLVSRIGLCVFSRRLALWLFAPFPSSGPRFLRSVAVSSLLSRSGAPGVVGFRGLPGFMGFTGIFVCEGYVARILHAELSLNVLMEPACHFMISFLGNFVSLLIQAHWGDTDSCWSGYSSGSF